MLERTPRPWVGTEGRPDALRAPRGGQRPNCASQKDTPTPLCAAHERQPRAHSPALPGPQRPSDVNRVSRLLMLTRRTVIAVEEGRATDLRGWPGATSRDSQPNRRAVR